MSHEQSLETNTASESGELPRLPWWAISFTGIVLLALAVFLTSVRAPGESPVYQKASKRYLAGKQFYRPNDPPAFTYPPLMVLTYTSVMPFPKDVQRTAWMFLNLGLFAVSIGIIFRMTWPVTQRSTLRTRPPIWLNCLLIFILSVRFITSPFEYESHDVLIMTLVLLAGNALSRHRDKLAGAWGGLAAASKATPLLLLPVLVWQKRFRAAGLFVAVMIGATLLPDFFVSNPDATTWVQSWNEKFISKVSVGDAPDAAGAWGAYNTLNQSLVGSLYRLTTTVKNRGNRINVALVDLDGLPFRILCWSSQLIVLCLIVFATRPSRWSKISNADRSFFQLGEIAVVLCGMLLLSPMSSTQHFCVLLAPMTFCVTYVMYRHRSKIVIGLLVVIAFFSIGGAKDIVGSELDDLLTAYGGTTICTFACLLASSYILTYGIERETIANREAPEEMPALTRAA